ncbi:MAG: Crp/Fnr family transcriptional regulator, partial [Chthoniobacterales bacterium]
PFSGFALVVAGRARLMASDADGGAVQIGELAPGECFGESLTAGGASEKISVVADSDLKVLVFSDAAIDDLLNRHPSLASEIGDALEARRQAALAARKRPDKIS